MKFKRKQNEPCKHCFIRDYVDGMYVLICIKCRYIADG